VHVTRFRRRPRGDIPGKCKVFSAIVIPLDYLKAVDRYSAVPDYVIGRGGGASRLTALWPSMAFYGGPYIQNNVTVRFCAEKLPCGFFLL
jgi:hypothetical protein